MYYSDAVKPKGLGEVVVVGMGQLGTELAEGFSAIGHPIVPVRRGDSLEAVAKTHPDPALVLVAVAEKDLHPVLGALPAAYRDRVALLQNELLPRDWERHGLPMPTVAVIWFEKKAGKPRKVLLETPVAGPEAARTASALTAIDVPAHVVPDADIVFELVAKNLYILTTNLVGLAVGGTVGELRRRHGDLLAEVAEEVLDVQEALVGGPLARIRLRAHLLRAIEADPDHAARGRTAPERLERTLRAAKEQGVPVPRLERLMRELG